ncbi:hypothetical protein ABID21_003894 [Pseudorhizobium tarimense]|uniref:DUF6894 domain-containing protein n=1 Tax=Pseudorhizobium tarimense TaxID=1079109 RepID=A0ABV2HB31_9HYPH|nr:hypothetical protein [Pseudorhizobium tarimense]MCJ8520677.1 hypothetical protein [Pseudorhizobium tarimense]
MPRYYFHIRRGEEIAMDPEGVELASPEQAHKEAVLAARELLAARLLNGEPIDGDTIEIKDEQATLVDTLPLKSVLDPKA